MVAATLALATAAPAPATAEWLKATSRHFVIYADTDRAALQRDAVGLERFDAAIRRTFPSAAGDVDAEANRVTVYVLPSGEAVSRLTGDRNVAGVYLPRVSGSVAFTPRLGDGTDAGALSPRIVLLHEYTHHYLFSAFTAAYPAWFSEGFAEFASTFTERQGKFWLGMAANHRGYGLFMGKPLSIAQLFAPPARLSPEQQEAVYGRGWLLTHYVMFDSQRRAQLGTYLGQVNAGKSSLDAATAAFGDLRALDRALDTYLTRRTLPAISYDPATLPAAATDIRPLTAGERALIALRIQSTRGVDSVLARSLYAKGKVAAAPFGTDSVAQGWLAEMALDAGDLAGAEAAADAALTSDARSSQALLYKARVHLLRARAAPGAAAWTEARGWIIRANRADNNDAAALALFYQSFEMAGAPPPSSAVAGLYRAIELVPEDRGMRFLAARQRLIDGDTAAARALLRPLAYDPHVAPDNPAARLLATLDGGATGPAALRALEDLAKVDAAVKR